MAATPATVKNRSCRYCKAKFKPIRLDQRFCKPAHRKAFWKYGGLPFDKMKEQIMKDVRKEFRPMLNDIIQQELRKYAQYAKVVEDYSIPLRLPAAPQPQSTTVPPSSRSRRA